MNALTTLYTITETRGGRNWRVNRVNMGESHVMFRHPRREKCVEYIARHASNGIAAALAYFNAYPADRPAKHDRCSCPLCMSHPIRVSTAAEMRADMRDRDERAALAMGLPNKWDDDRMACKVCGKPVDEDDACDEHLDVHCDCEPEFIAMRADAAVDRLIDASLLGEV